mmetsp:Transcript_19328/g.54760  ORF Transcript_19328/g.54760 Transcript_19328/m.54760 type:complete len:167 (+) Transcript_19328:362-862(+)
MKLALPQVGENTTVSFGHITTPKQNDLSGLPADLGHSQKGVLGTVVTIATPSSGLLRKPRSVEMRGQKLQNPELPDTRRNDTILSNGTSTSMFPIQKRSVPSLVTSTDRTRLYQNHATSIKFATVIATTVPCAPMGTAAITSSANMASKKMNLALNENENGDDWKE